MNLRPLQIIRQNITTIQTDTVIHIAELLRLGCWRSLRLSYLEALNTAHARGCQRVALLPIPLELRSKLKNGCTLYAFLCFMAYQILKEKCILGESEKEILCVD